ncbi:hypothetical protein DL96DRAFT_1811978 [Flagelloscypha sp. PMI_526]|nr:hypothetical protein DL96DRAFT_1811978 [Flagelloscypha sp. PMI_526]
MVAFLLTLMSEWTFNHRSGYDDSDSDDDFGKTQKPLISQEQRFLEEAENLAKRDQGIKHTTNPWSIARFNAASKQIKPSKPSQPAEPTQLPQIAVAQRFTKRRGNGKTVPDSTNKVAQRNIQTMMTRRKSRDKRPPNSSLAPPSRSTVPRSALAQSSPLRPRPHPLTPKVPISLPLSSNSTNFAAYHNKTQAASRLLAPQLSSASNSLACSFAPAQNTCLNPTALSSSAIIASNSDSRLANGLVPFPSPSRPPVKSFANSAHASSSETKSMRTIGGVESYQSPARQPYFPPLPSLVTAVARPSGQGTSYQLTHPQIPRFSPIAHLKHPSSPLMNESYPHPAKSNHSSTRILHPISTRTSSEPEIILPKITRKRPEPKPAPPSPKPKRHRDPYMSGNYNYDDPDEAWSTFKSRKSISHEPPVKRQAQFKLPTLHLEKLSTKEGPKLVATNSKPRVITFLPPPLIASPSSDIWPEPIPDSDDTIVAPSSSPIKHVCSPTTLLPDKQSPPSTFSDATTAFQCDEENGDITVQSTWSFERYKAVREGMKMRNKIQKPLWMLLDGMETGDVEREEEEKTPYWPSTQNS